MQGLIETRHLAFECNNLPFSTQISYSRTYYILKILLTFEFCQNVAFETFPQRCIVDLFLCGQATTVADAANSIGHLFAAYKVQYVLPAFYVPFF